MPESAIYKKEFKCKFSHLLGCCERGICLPDNAYRQLGVLLAPLTKQNSEEEIWKADVRKLYYNYKLIATKSNFTKLNNVIPGILEKLEP